MSVLTSSEYNLNLHTPHKKKLNFFFLRMEKEELSFIIENNGEKREKFVKRHIRNITFQ